MTYLTSQEISHLESYNFISNQYCRSGRNRNENETLLCIRMVGGIKQLDTVKRANVTTWEVFKSYLGLGKLAGCDLRLTAIASYLESKSIKELAVDSKAYQTIHQIASRMLTYRKEGEQTPIPRLWQHLTTQKKELTLDKVRREHLYESDQHGVRSLRTQESIIETRKMELSITPLTTFGHLVIQANLLKGLSFDEITVRWSYWGLYDHEPRYRVKYEEEQVNGDSPKDLFLRHIAEDIYPEEFFDDKYCRHPT